jgi:hypothetical protein
MNEFLAFIGDLFGNSDWPARWHCGNWSDFHGWLYIVSSLGISLAYFSIPLMIYRVLHAQTAHFRYSLLLKLFILFIFFCGTTHFVDALIFWNPIYRFAALNLFVAGCVSWLTVFVLGKNIGSLLNLRTPDDLQLEVNRKTEELRKSNEYLKSVTNDLDNFIYSASHDLKAPVNNLESLLIMAQAEMEGSPEEMEDYLQKMESQVNRIKVAIGKLTDAAKLERSPYEGEETILLAELLEEFLADNRMAIEEAGADFRFDVQESSIQYNRSALKTILFNLLGNSLKYRQSNQALVVQVRVRKAADRIQIQVADNGLGIDLKRHGDKLFGLFKRFHQNIPGTGMGLYFVKKILDKNQGHIEVESQPQAGTTITITL